MTFPKLNSSLALKTVTRRISPLTYLSKPRLPARPNAEGFDRWSPEVRNDRMITTTLAEVQRLEFCIEN